MVSDTDSTVVAADSTGVAPSADGSQTQPVQPSSTPGIDPLKFLEIPEFQEGVRRLLQSEKDKGVAKVQKEVGDLKEDFSRIAARLNVPPEKVAQVQEELRREDDWNAMREFYLQSQEARRASLGKEVDVEGSVKAILETFGLEDDPGAQQVAASATGIEAVKLVTKYAKNRLKQSPASPTLIAAPPGGSPPVSGKFPEKTSDQLAIELMDLNKRPTDPESRARAAEIHEELTRRGE